MMKDLLNLEILTKTFDDLPIGVGVFHVEDLNDPKSIRYVFMNKVVLYEMRKEKEEVIGKRIIEVAPEAYEHEGGLMVIETYRRIAAEGGSVNLGLVKYSNHLVAGTYECSVHHIKDNYVYVMLRNVTELEEKKNELEQKNKELSQFALIASHDLKEPLNSITNCIYLLVEEFQGTLKTESKELVEYLSSATSRMKNLIDSLLEYSDIGKQKVQTVIDCNELLDNVKKDLAVRIQKVNATIQVDDLPQIKGYQTEVRLLFQNLISNSIKFSREGVAPIIKITAKKQDGWIFRVQDNGIGIADEYQDKIFGIFERLHSKDDYEGSGIGLAHCKKIVDLHKGKIWVESVLGEGSTFCFLIPE